MKKNMITLTIFGFLLLGLKSAAGAQTTPVDNSVQYGEKYSCLVKTTDEKNYLLNIEWSAKPAKYSLTPKWEETLKYQLSENSVQIDSGNYSDLGLGYSKTELTFNYDKYVLAGNSNFATRVGTNYSDVNIDLKKDYDKNGKVVLSVVSFKASHTYDKFYGSSTSKEIELAVLGSECSVEALNKP